MTAKIINIFDYHSRFRSAPSKPATVYILPVVQSDAIISEMTAVRVRIEIEKLRQGPRKDRLTYLN